jgi:hypothetical protein
MDPWFVAMATSIPVAAALFVWTHRWRERVRARRVQHPGVSPQNLAGLSPPS